MEVAWVAIDGVDGQVGRVHLQACQSLPKGLENTLVGGVEVYLTPLGLVQLRQA